MKTREPRRCPGVALWLVALVTFLNACGEPEAPAGAAKPAALTTVGGAPPRAPEQPDPGEPSGSAATAPGAPEPALDAAAVAANNRGVGLMGRFEYDVAQEVFAALAAAHPDWLEVRVNLALATLNRQQDGDEVEALALVEAVLAEDSAHLRGHYVAGLLRLYTGEADRALPHFLRVAEGDPQDAYAAYYAGQTLAQLGRHEAALDSYRRALALDPYLRSAYYGAFQGLQRARRAEEARELMQAYQRLGGNPRARLAEFKYTRMGPKAEALALGLRQPTPVPKPSGPLFLAPVELLPDVQDGPLPARPAAITPVDTGAERWLYIPGRAAAPGVPNTLLRADGKFGWTLDGSHPLALVPAVNAAIWGDFDNDGKLDVYLARRGPNQLWRQRAAGVWEDVTGASGTAAGAHDTVDGLAVDADHDGDLDLFLVHGDAPDELLSNNLDGTFRPLAEQAGIGGEPRASRTAIAVDLDTDRDLDLVVLHTAPPHRLHVNDRLWQYRPAAGADALRTQDLASAVAADLDGDGRAELYGVDGQGVLLSVELHPESLAAARRLGQVSAPGAPWIRLEALDVDGDGRLELLVADAEGWRIVTVEDSAVRTLFEYRAPADHALLGAASLFQDPGSGSGIASMDSRGRVQYWPPGPGRFPFLALRFSGGHDTAHAMRSNASGIGARAAVRVGPSWTVRSGLREHSGPGQDYQPLAVGLGGAAAADFVAIDWSDGVYQTELDLAAGQLHEIVETQRQLSSCPVLFAWDGHRYVFVTDLLGVGGMGYAVAPGEYATPRPRERLLLPADSVAPRDGRFMLKLTEPMEETGYFDAVRLVAYDLPPGWDLVLDERMGIGPPPPTGETRFFRTQALPARASDGRGEDVTAAIQTVDGRAAAPGVLDRRFIGRLESEALLTLQFAEALVPGPGEPLLVADGWVEYPYSQTMFAAWQAAAAYHAPTLEFQRGEGEDGWEVLLAEFGYPAGMPRRMSVPLSALPAGVRALRLRTNQEIYWDRLAVAYAEPPPEHRRHTLELLAARVAKTGFPLRLEHAQRRPEYLYERRSPFWDARYMAGYYTGLGDALELVAAPDGALAIIGSGEELHLEFADSLPALQAGWTRRFVFEADGWTKDMDLYTRHGDTVAPLPSDGYPEAAPARLHELYNQRYQAGP